MYWSVIKDSYQERIYSNGMWSVIKRINEYGQYFSVVRYGSVFFEKTFRTLSDAIKFCDESR